MNISSKLCNIIDSSVNIVRKDWSDIICKPCSIREEYLPRFYINAPHDRIDCLIQRNETASFQPEFISFFLVNVLRLFHVIEQRVISELRIDAYGANNCDINEPCCLRSQSFEESWNCEFWGAVGWPVNQTYLSRHARHHHDLSVGLL